MGPGGRLRRQRLQAGGPARQASPIYCSGESLLANGNLFIAGGNLESRIKGLNKTFTFDPFSETWHRQGDMGHGRWYPGQVVLPDGRVAILGGYTERGSTQDNPQFEVWPRRDRAPPSDTNLDAERLPVERISSGDRTTAMYPHLFLTPGGKVLLAGPGAGDSALLDPRTFTWRDLGGLPRGLDRIGSNAVLLPGGARVLQIGGYDFPTFDKTKTSRARNLHRVRGHQRPRRLEDSLVASPSAARTGTPSCCPTRRW